MTNDELLFTSVRPWRVERLKGPCLAHGARAVSARSGHLRNGRAEVSRAPFDHSTLLRPETGRAPRARAGISARFAA